MVVPTFRRHQQRHGSEKGHHDATLGGFGKRGSSKPPGDGVQHRSHHPHEQHAVRKGVASPSQPFHEEKHHPCHQGKRQALHVRLDLGGARRLNQAHDAQPDPHRKRVERADVGVVPFTRLQRGLVEVHHNGDARHQEQHGHHRRALGVSERLEHQADQAQQKRQEVQLVPAPVGLHGLGEFRLVAQPFFVDEIHPAQPIAVHEIAVALVVVLLADVIPKEVPEVHPAELVAREKPQVLALAWLEVLQQAVQPRFGLKGPPNVFLASRLVRQLGGATQLVLQRGLFALQPPNVGRPVVDPLLEHFHHVRRERASNAFVGEGGAVGLARLGVAHRQHVLRLHAKRVVKAQSKTAKQATQRPFQLRLLKVAAKDVVFQVVHELRP